MNDQSRGLVRAATGPIILITVGTLFALEKFTPYRFGQTWPVLLIVIGLLRLLGGGNPRKMQKYRQMTGGPWATRNPFPPYSQPPAQPQWKAGSGAAPPPASAPPYSSAGEAMPDMTPPPPPRPGERR